MTKTVHVNVCNVYVLVYVRVYETNHICPTISMINSNANQFSQFNFTFATISSNLLRKFSNQIEIFQIQKLPHWVIQNCNFASKYQVQNSNYSRKNQQKWIHLQRDIFVHRFPQKAIGMLRFYTLRFLCVCYFAHIVFQWVLCIIKFPTLPNFCSSLLQIFDILLCPQTSLPPLSFSCGIWAKTNGCIYCVIACDLVVTPPHFIDAFTIFVHSVVVVVDVIYFVAVCSPKMPINWPLMLLPVFYTLHVIDFNVQRIYIFDWAEFSIDWQLMLYCLTLELEMESLSFVLSISMYITDECPIWN